MTSVRGRQPWHQERPSLLSSSSGYENYRGFLNLIYVIFALGSFRLVLENVLQYGLLIELDWPIRFIADPTHWPSVLLIVLVTLFIQAGFWLEVQLSRDSHRTYVYLQFVNLLLLLVFPMVYINCRHPNPIGAFIAVGFYVIVFLKLFSYMHVNYQSRLSVAERKKTDSPVGPGPVFYPDNLTSRDLYYFILAPTLCYELNYPRSARIRKRFLLRRCAEILVLLSLQYCLVQQWILPILSTIDRPLNQYSHLENTERLLRLALPNHLLWLSFFYVYFHSTLNLLAELLRFGDRLFYRDWWNASDLYEFWNRWNTIVHDFCKRHVYTPLVRQFGWNQFLGSLVVFLISAFFHEYLISVPLRILRPWSFLAMIVQIPIGLAVRRIKAHSHTSGNISVWFSLILIQPVAILLYIQDLFYRDFVRHETS